MTGERQTSSNFKPYRMFQKETKVTQMKKKNSGFKSNTSFVTIKNPKFIWKSDVSSDKNRERVIDNLISPSIK